MSEYCDGDIYVSVTTEQHNCVPPPMVAIGNTDEYATENRELHIRRCAPTSSTLRRPRSCSQTVQRLTCITSAEGPPLKRLWHPPQGLPSSLHTRGPHWRRVRADPACTRPGAQATVSTRTLYGSTRSASPLTRPRSNGQERGKPV